jgi:hypothetical protein
MRSIDASNVAETSSMISHRNHRDKTRPAIPPSACRGAHVGTKHDGKPVYLPNELDERPGDQIFRSWLRFATQ